MSVIDKLTIRGIRNFGVDAADEQKIAFATPLTLILGANGCGKTTIIEGIKYALTGEMPPNCKEGQSFIHNPDVLNISESLGQVKLKVRNEPRGIECTISRSAKVVKKKDKKNQFRSLDATITVSENGREPKQTSKRNNDATDDMCSLMGVSKAIISNVLFCHQEEANWPLGTDLEVMSRFDKIFGTTEYNNALDKIRQYRKTFEAAAKDKLITLKELEMVKEMAEKMSCEISVQQNEKSEMEERLRSFGAELAPLHAEYKETTAIEQQLRTITADRKAVEAELKKEKEHQQAIAADIHEIFTGDKAALNTEIGRFEVVCQTKKDESRQAEDDLKAFEEEYQKIERDINVNDRKHSGLIQQREREQDLYAERAQYLRDLSSKLKINVDFDIANCNERAAQLIGQINAVLTVEKKSVTDMATDIQNADVQQEQKIRELNNEEVKKSSELTVYNNQLNTLDRDLKKTLENISKCETSRTKLEGLNKRLEGLQKVLAEMKNNSSSQELEATIQSCRETRSKLNEEIDDIAGLMGLLTEMSTALAAISSKESQINSREAEKRRILNKHNDNLQRLFPDGVVESNFKRHTESLGAAMRTTFHRLEAEVRLNERKLQELKINHRNKRTELSNLEKEERELEDKIFEKCESTPFNEILESTRENVAKYQMEFSSLKSSELFYKQYIRKVEHQPCCPLCHKDMNRNEVDGLTNELNDQIDQLPQNIARAEQSLKDESEKLEGLTDLKPKVERLERIRSQLITKLKDDIKVDDAQIAALQEKIKKSEAEIKDPKEKAELINTMAGDMSLLDEHLRDLERNKSDLERLKQTVQDAPTDLSLEDLTKKRKELSDRIKALDVDIVSKEKRLREDNDRLRKCRDAELELQQQIMKCREGVAHLDVLRSNETKINAEVAVVRQQQQKAEEELVPVREKRKQAEKEREETKAANNRKYESARTRIDSLRKINDSIDRASAELAKLADLKLDTEIDGIARALCDLRNAKGKKSKEMAAITASIKQLTKEIAEQDKTKRNLHDNLKLKKSQEKISAKELELEKLRERESHIDFQQTSEKLGSLSAKISKITKEKYEIEGRVEEKKNLIETKEKQLAESKYKDSALNYSKAMCAVQTHEQTVDDLSAYAEELERALTQFHNEKMEQINTLIRELWRSIYKGNDIDYIRITTEEVKGTSRRRSYTYRVVAVKNDASMDFRGQSSAGQRVLACLIIRIALAETFSGSCGVLALDEPTTNLDRANIQSLCEALNRLVQQREGQDNFMLIVITHDEEFIDALGNVTSYYKLKRDDNGKSQIEKLRVRN